MMAIIDPPFEHAKESDRWYKYIATAEYRKFWKLTADPSESIRTPSDSANTVNNKDAELIEKYIVIFDNAIDEIMRILNNDSLARFYRSKEYVNMVSNAN